MPRADFRFAHALRVRWAEADMQGVVFNGNYLTYFDVGFTEYLRAIVPDDPQRLREVFDRMVLVRAALDFERPARFDDMVDVCVRTARLGNASVKVLFELHRGEERLVACESVYVYTDGGKSATVPASLRASIRQYEQVPPDE